MTTHPDVDMVSFTGSTVVGKLTMANAAQTLKKVSLELGGKNPQIVFPDADLDDFIDAAVFGAYFNAGECCNAGSRLIVHRDIADEVVQRVAALSAEVKVGDPLDPRDQGRRDHHAGASRQDRAPMSQRRVRRVRMSAMAAKPLDLGMGQFMAPTILSAVSAGHGRGAGRSIRTGAVCANIRDAGGGRRVSPIPSTTDCRPASGAATSTPA